MQEIAVRVRREASTVNTALVVVVAEEMIAEGYDPANLSPSAEKGVCAYIADFEIDKGADWRQEDYEDLIVAAEVQP